MISIFESFLLFLPVCAVICLVSTALRRDDFREIFRVSARLFVNSTILVVLVCAALYVLMEYLQDGRLPF